MKALKHFSIYIALFGIAAASLGLTSCLSKKSDKKIQVAALMKNIKKGGFDEAYLNALKAKAESENVELIVYTCNYDATIQLDQIKNMLTQGIKYFNTGLMPHTPVLSQPVWQYGKSSQRNPIEKTCWHNS